MPNDFKPVPSERAFRAGRLYSEIDWMDFDGVLEEFRERLKSWYIDPLRSLMEHNDTGFTVVGLCALLIDALSQYSNGTSHSGRQQFKQYVRAYIPAFETELSAPITYEHGTHTDTLSDFADVFYSAFRCGILHQAHVPLFGAISRDKDEIVTEASPHATETASGEIVPTVVINSRLLAQAVIDLFDEYICALKDSNHTECRSNFKMTFEASFGVQIGSP